MVAAVSANTGAVIRTSIRTGQDAFDWLGEHWSVAKGIVRLWLEQKEAIERERRDNERSRREFQSFFATRSTALMVERDQETMPGTLNLAN